MSAAAARQEKPRRVACTFVANHLADAIGVALAQSIDAKFRYVYRRGGLFQVHDALIENAPECLASAFSGVLLSDPR